MASRRYPLARYLRRWLAAGDSLTRRLDDAFGGVNVHKLFQGNDCASREEWRHLGLGGARRAHVREVVLHGGGRPLVFARSVVGARQVRRTWRAIVGLGNRSLAELLFGNRTTFRTPLQWSHWPPTDARTRHLRRQWRMATGEAWPARSAWARWSVFKRRGVPLLVTEVFTPAMHERSVGRQPGARDSGGKARKRSRA